MTEVERRPAPRCDSWPESWAVQVTVDAERIASRLRVLEQNAGAGAGTVAKEVRACLETARCASHRSARVRGPLDRWRGTAVEHAYRSLHSAKILMVDVLPPREVAALVPEVLGRLAATLDRNDPRRTAAEKALQSTELDVDALRVAVKQAMTTSYDACDEEHVRLRSFRNIILVSSAVIALFTIVLLFLVALSPESIPLCFAPSVTGSGGTGVQTIHVCPSGEHETTPSAGDVLIIAGLGAVGGSLGVLLAIRNLRGTSTAYGVPMALAVLKVPSGALTAVIGMLLLAGGFIPGLSNLDSQRQILAYALLFGYAQQLITRLADGQAQTILNRLPSKDPQADQPVVPAVTAPATPAAAPRPLTAPATG